ncbi:MAG: hypothetical protein J1E85_10255 [Ruminococcus sp.]|nr:hypothetical protein [Ruminococcus sp.]
MHLKDLYYHIMTTKEVAVVGREFSAYGMEYALVGLVNTAENTELVLFEYDKRIADDDCTEPENMTNREFALADKYRRKNLTELLHEVIIDGKKFNINGSHGCSLDSAFDSDSYVLAEFIKQGWRSEKFFDYSPEYVNLSFQKLDEKIESLSQLDLSKKISLLAYETCNEEFPQIKLDLEVDKEIDKIVELFDGKEKICIKRVHLVDLKEVGEEFSDMDFFSRICPNGMRIPVIEYTCRNDEICFNISLSSYLDSFYGDSCNGFAGEDGTFCGVIGIQLTNDKKDRKYFTIQSSVNADTKQIECEIVSCSKEIENPHIEEFLI